MQIILFLDFDGVLHPAYGGKGVSADFRHLPLFEHWLRSIPNVQVVISSSWRDCMSLEKLQSFFSDDIKPRIIDKCPVLISPVTDYVRYEEIQQWIIKNDYRGHWLALDDAAHEFPSPCEQLIKCDPRKGLTERVILKLTNMLRVLINMHHD